MTSFQQVGKSFLVFSLVLTIAVITAFSLISESSLAVNVLPQTFNQSMSLAAIDRIGAVGKNLEGKAQETIGNITGDPKDQATGKAKQVESQARRATAEIGDNVKVKGRTKAIGKNLEGKSQEAVGTITGDSKKQTAGKMKQGESQARNAIEDVKEKIQAIFN